MTVKVFVSPCFRRNSVSPVPSRVPPVSRNVNSRFRSPRFPVTSFRTVSVAVGGARLTSAVPALATVEVVIIREPLLSRSVTGKMYS